MTTTTPEPARPSERQPHQERQVAESFGANAARYDRARPRYPQAMVERIVAASPGHDVLDVGCGTGIVARLLQTAGCTVLGVEPDARMAEHARQHGFEVEVATFETWDPAGRAFDAITAGQSWHWVDPAAGAAKAAEVLRPEGRLAVFWNAFDPPAEVAEGIGEVYQRVRPDLPYRPGMAGPDAYAKACAKVADAVRETGAFGEPEQWRFDWERPYTRGEWLDQIPTFGGFGQLPQDQQEELLAGVGAVIDAVGGSFTMRYATMVATAARHRAA